MQTISFEVNDTVYQNFINKIGKENVVRYFANFVNDYGKDDDKLPPAYQRLGGAPPFKIPDNFDDMECEFPEFYESVIFPK